MKQSFQRAAAIAAISVVAACGSNQQAQDPVGPRPGPDREFDPEAEDSIFGEGGFSLNTLDNIFSGGEGGSRGGAIPVNKFLWQASLDTLAFLPLASTDPFTGVIATEWGVTPDAPNERFKVTAYLLNTELSATSLRVAVFREQLGENGVWLPAPVNPETPRKLEDAILTRARQIRLASDTTTITG